MSEVFGQVFAFVLMAFLLGVLVGWMFWRYRRVSVAEEQWSSVTRELAGLAEQALSLQRERDALAGQVSRASAEVDRLQGLLTAAWHDRDLRQLELNQAATALGDARSALERTTAQARYLQRRVTELSILNAADRSSGGGGSPGWALDAGNGRHAGYPLSH